MLHEVRLTSSKKATPCSTRYYKARRGRGGRKRERERERERGKGHRNGKRTKHRQTGRDRLAARKVDMVGLEATDESTRFRTSHRKVLAYVSNQPRNQGHAITRKIEGTKTNIRVQQTKGHKARFNLEAKPPQINFTINGPVEME